MTEVILFDPSLSENQTRKDENFKFNVGLLSIASFLESKGVSTKIYYKTSDYRNKLKKIITPNTLLIGISTMTAQYDYAITLAQKIKKIYPHIPIVVGGCHARLFAREVLSRPEFDIVVPGDGEYPILQIVKRLQKHQSLRSIKGIGYKKNKKQYLSFDRTDTDLLTLPPMNYDTVYGFEPMTWYDGQKSMYVYSGTGCPYSCTFCINSVSNKGIRQRSIGVVVDEIEYLLNQYQITHIYLTDEFFWVNMTRLIEFLDLIENRKLKFNWFIQNRVDTIGPKKLNVRLLKRMMHLGCSMMLLGAESGSNRMLKIMNKHLRSHQIIAAVRYLKKADITPWLSFIIGMPDENRSDYLNTFKLIGKIVKIYPEATISGPSLYRPIPGSLMYQRAISYYPEDSSVHFDTKKDFVISDYPNSLQVARCEYPWLKDRLLLKDLLLCIERFYKYPSSILLIKSSVLLLIKLLYVIIVKRDKNTISTTYYQFHNNNLYLLNIIDYYLPKGKTRIINRSLDPEMFNPLLWFKWKQMVRYS